MPEYIKLNPLVEVLTSWFIVVREVEPERARRLAELWYFLNKDRLVHGKPKDSNIH